MKIALDTNILVYGRGLNGPAKQAVIERVMAAVPPSSLRLPLQALGELFCVLVRKGGYTPAKAAQEVTLWSDGIETLETTQMVFQEALQLATRHRLQIWDSLILAAAAVAECHVLLSEDMQDGFVWSGVTVVNPFATSVHPLLQSVLNRKQRH